MRGHPAVQTGGVAVLFGLDPLAVNGAHPEDYEHYIACLDRASELSVARDEALITELAKAVGAHTGNRVGKAIAVMLRQMRG